jgi:hypothetical protein
MADSVLSEQALRAARQRYTHDAYRHSQDARKAQLAGYDVIAETYAAAAELCRRAAAAELVDPKESS